MTTKGGQSIVIRKVASAGGFENNILSASLLGRRGVSAELGGNPCLRKGSTTITVRERSGLYYADLFRPEAHDATSIYATTDDDEDTSRSYDSENNESQGEYDPWLDEGDSSDDADSRANMTIATAIHAETTTQHECDQRDYYNGQPVSTENAAYMRQT